MPVVPSISLPSVPSFDNSISPVYKLAHLLVSEPKSKELKIQGQVKYERDDIPEGEEKKSFISNFCNTLSGLLGISPERITNLLFSKGSIIVSYEISGNEEELNELKSKILSLPQNAIVVDGLISENIFP